VLLSSTTIAAEGGELAEIPAPECTDLRWGSQTGGADVRGGFLWGPPGGAPRTGFAPSLMPATAAPAKANEASGAAWNPRHQSLAPPERCRRYHDDSRQGRAVAGPMAFPLPAAKNAFRSPKCALAWPKNIVNQRLVYAPPERAGSEILCRSGPMAAEARAHSTARHGGPLRRPAIQTIRRGHAQYQNPVGRHRGGTKSA
jgi:hypothetical protein